MDKETDMAKTPPRPLISEYADAKDFIRDMLAYLKKTQRSFSVLTATKKLRRISPALVSLIVKGERKLTPDRVDEFSKLLSLNPQEKSYFKAWVEFDKNSDELGSPFVLSKTNARKDVSVHILNDWINVYVKDCFQLPEVRKNPSLIYKHLSMHASPKRIEKAISFLLREGHLRRTPDGDIVTETPLTVANSPVPSKKIRQFHKGALDIARNSLELVPTTERMANTLIVPLNAKRYQELLELIHEFADKIQNFASSNEEDGDRLYQLIVNLSPTGGKTE